MTGKRNHPVVKPGCAIFEDATEMKSHYRQDCDSAQSIEGRNLLWLANPHTDLSQ
jgi:hypothetical protein